MIIITKRNHPAVDPKLMFKARLVLIEQPDGDYYIQKNYSGPSDITISKDLLLKVIENPDGKLVYDWQ
jgi:hypothetical protein